MYKFFLLATLVLTTYCRFDPDLARNLFYINVATYCRLSSVKDWTCRPCIESKLKLTNVSPFFNSTGDVLGLLGVSKSPEAIILVFRGTDPRGWKNWAQDFNFIKTKFPICTNGCQVHRGFYHAYQQIQAAVIKSVKQYIEKYQINSLIIVGHSLGGALATHAAISLNNQGVSVDQLYTYGSPRVGDVKFSQWFDGYIKTVNKNRVTHGHDPVPHLPPHDFGFTHVPHEIFEVNPRQYVTCTDNGQKQDPNCSDKFKTDTNVIDHGNYCGVDFFTIYASCQ